MAQDPNSAITVMIDERSGVERSLKKFKRMCESFGVVREYRKRQEYKKPSVKHKEKTEAADKRRKKTAMKSTRVSKYQFKTKASNEAFFFAYILTKSEISMDQNQIDTNLSNLNGWKLDTLSNSIHKEFSFKSYLKNIAFVNAVAWIANKMNHHPDLEVSFNKCVVKITTHDKSGLNDLDFQLAHEIEKL